MIAACVVSGSWNFGTGCELVLSALTVDALLVVADVKDGFDAHSDLIQENGLEDSAQDLFQQLEQEGTGQSDPTP